MIIKEIKLNNFKIFEGERTFKVSTPITLILGGNGSGKTTIAQSAILYALYGYTEQSLEKIITKGKERCTVKVEIDNYIIERSYPPTDIKIYKDGIEVPFSYNTEKQLYLTKLFGSIENFRKFRMIDIKSGINIFEEGKTSLKKTLFNFNQEKINEVRTNLLNIKRQREIYNKDKAVVYPHAPSQKRYEALMKKLLNVSNQMVEVDREYTKVDSEYMKLSNKKSATENSLLHYRNQKNTTFTTSECPTCKRPIRQETKIRIVEEANQKITELNKQVADLIELITNQKDLVYHFKEIKSNLQKKKEVLSNFKIKLESRLKQKDYIWSEKDILVVKKAIDKFDEFMSFCLTQWISKIEPIINNIIRKIGFTVKFCLDAKNEFEIKLFKDGVEHSYKDLSSGQRLIFSLAFQLAVLLERGETGLVIADEGFSTLDATNLNMVMDLFKNLPFQLICIIHRYTETPEGIKAIVLDKGVL